MATLISTNVGLSTGWYSQYNVYSFNTTTTGSNTYMHFKTNVSNTANKIIMIEAIGYNYGPSQAVRCSWCFYAHNGSTIDRGRQTFANTGLTADGVYSSSDGYAVIRAYSSNPYYIGYILNAHSGPAGYGTNVQITAAAANTTSGNHY